MIFYIIPLSGGELLKPTPIPPKRGMFNGACSKAANQISILKIFMFDINYAEIFQNIPPQLATALIAMIPIAELRVSIPVALGVYELPVWQAIFFSVIADILVAAMVIYFLGAFHKILYGKQKWINSIFDWVFKRTRQKFFKKYEAWGNLALMLFVAIPLPITGAWTASVASWMFGVSKKKSLFFISIGVIISACIVTLISLGFIKII